MAQDEEAAQVEETEAEPKVAEVTAPIPAAAGSENENNESKGEPMDEVVEEEEVSKASEITEL